MPPIDLRSTAIMRSIFQNMMALDSAIARDALDFLSQYPDLLLCIKFLAVYLPYGFILIGLYLLFNSRQDRQIAVIGVVSVAIAGFICLELGHLVARDRPYASGLIPNLLEHGSKHRSWPSSHATGSFAFSTVLFSLLENRRIAWAALLMALMISLARIISGVHFATDVISGALLGSGVAYALVIICSPNLIPKMSRTQLSSHSNLSMNSWSHALAWLLIAIVLCLGWDLTGWDLPISRLFATAQGFALTEHPIWGKGIYHMQRGVAWLTLFTLVWASWRAIGPFATMEKAERIAMIFALIVSLLVIQYLKRKSLTSCPWSLQEFGGPAQYISHWVLGVRDGGGGRCFPAGHPSGALCFLAVPVFLLWHNKRWAYSLLGVVLLAGSIWGGTQLVRGAHYVSHTVWTTVFCLATALICRAIWAMTVKSRSQSDA
jgi:membrane-associated PAP2 superfamily phosphatase